MAKRRLILDSGALSALADGEPRMMAWLYEATQNEMLVGIPAPVLAETLTGQASDARIHRVIPADDVVLETTAGIAREAGALRHRSHRCDATVDAIVIATAATCTGSIVMTSNPHDLQLLSSNVPDARLAVRSVNELPPRSDKETFVVR
jgi:predicted nucleic acid-binding protein